MSEGDVDLGFGAPLEQAADRLRPEDLILLADTVGALQALYPGRLQAVKLVGSRARGSARPDSDYDLLVFLDACDYDIEVPRLALLGQQLEARHALGPISLSPMTVEQFVGLDAKYEGITAAFRRDALRLWP